jgi:hypothetical protein
LQITEERKKQVIDLYFNQHKSYAEIAEIIIAVSLGSKTNLSETFKHVLLIDSNNVVVKRNARTRFVYLSALL